jgi:hypothetical protein
MEYGNGTQLSPLPAEAGSQALAAPQLYFNNLRGSESVLVTDPGRLIRAQHKPGTYALELC